MIPADGNRAFRLMFWLFGVIGLIAGGALFGLNVDGYRPEGADVLAFFVTAFGAFWIILGFFASSVLKWISK